MAEFYHDLITEKSFKILQDLKREFDFILIGGWAIYLYTKALKSKDVDIIIDYNELEKFKKQFSIFKNERLKKYEAKIEEIDIDIYLPYFSDLKFPIEEIKNYTQSLEGFKVPIPEILLILKVKTYTERKGTIKGEKDLLDIFSLISNEKIDWKTYRELIKKYKLDGLNQKLKEIISSTKVIPQLNLLDHQISRLKKKILEKL
jgi:rubrerythrin